MKRAAGTRSALASPARQPRREALLRSGIALAVAVMLGVLGLLAGERSAERRAAAEGGQTGEHVAPPVARAQSPSSLQPQSPTAAASPSGVPPPAPAVAAPASPPVGSLSAPVGGQILALQAPASAPGGVENGTEGSVPTAPPAPVASARPDTAVEGVVLPPAALRPGGRGYRIQLGVFGDAGNALKLYEQIAAQGYEGHIQSRVMVGPFADRAAAEKARQALRRAGVGVGVVVPPEQPK